VWLFGLHKCHDYERILLLNDSLILGINGIENMKKSIDIMRNKDIDLWGHWDSSELNYHYVGTPIEIKQCLLPYLINFLESILPTCKYEEDYIRKIETQIVNNVRKLGYKTDVILKETDILNKYYKYKKNGPICCPSHYPSLLKHWIYKDCSFAIKWKYVLPHLLFNQIKHPFFNYLLRFLWTSEYCLFVSKPEKMTVFPNQTKFKDFNWFNDFDHYLKINKFI